MALNIDIGEIILGLVLFPTVGYIALEVNSLGKMDATQEARYAGLEQRINRIADALPDLKVKIAQEELSKPLTGAVVVLNPVKDAGGKWVSGVHVIDTATNARKTFVVPVNGPKDKSVAVAASGLAINLDKGATRFIDLAEWSAATGKPASTPDYIDAKNSFVLRGPTAEYAKEFEEIVEKAKSRPSAKLSGGFNSWEQLTVELSKHQLAYSNLSDQAVP